MNTPVLAEGEVLTGRYVLERQIGTGGAGVVWRAQDQALDRPVAVKMLHPTLAHDPAAAARFRSEATSAARLTHPNAVMVYDIGNDGDRDFLVMEFVGGPAFDVLLPHAPLAPSAVAHLGAAVAGALGMAHERGMLHRDVKPANILLTPDGVPKVADFGIARALGEATTRLTAPGSVMGTARYLAPEQLVDGPLDGRVDVYALGLLLHEALTGVPPWGSGTATEIASRRLGGDLPPPSSLRDDVPPGLDAVIRRATRLEADDRYTDGYAFAVALAPLAAPDGARQLDRLLRQVAPDHAEVLSARTYDPSSHRVGGTPPSARPRSGQPRAAHPQPGPALWPDPPPDPPGSRGRSSQDAAPSTRTPPRRRRRRRHPIRRTLGILLLMLTAAVGYAGLTDTPIPALEDVTRTVADSPVGELFGDVLDGISDRIGDN